MPGASDKAEHVALKEFILALMAERDEKNAQRYECIKEAMDLASKVQKLEVDSAMAAVEKATIKNEAAIEKRFDAVNEFRTQLAEQQQTFAKSGEVYIKIDALDKKVDAAFSQLQLSKGRDSGISSAWGVAAFAASLVISGIGLAVSIISATHK